MAQLLANNASALLVGGVSAVATTLTIEAARADLFPVGNTTNFATPLDWFKVTLEDVSGNTEIVRVGVRASASAVLTTVLRGQEGTVARAFAAGSVVELRVTALDIQNAVAPVGAEKIDAGSIQAQTATAVTTAGTSTAYSIATLPVQPSLQPSQRYQLKLHTPNGAAPTLVRDGLAAKAIVLYNVIGGKAAPSAGQLPTVFDVVYDGTDYVVLNPLPATGGATGAAGDTVFVENSRTVNSSYSVTVNKSASMVGPLVVATAKNVTVASGERLVVL